MHNGEDSDPKVLDLLLELLERVSRLEGKVNMLKWFVMLAFTVLGILITVISVLS